MTYRRALRLTATLSLLLLASCAAGHADRSLSGSIRSVWSVDVDQRRPAEPEGFSQAAVVAPGSPNELIVIGGRDARVRVYDINGHELRSIAINEPSDSGALALPNGLVVLGDVGGTLYGIDPVKGLVVWQYQLSTPFLAEPVALDDGVLIQTMDNRLYHFSAKGEKRWSYTGLGGGLGMYMTASPLVHNRTAYAVFTNGDAVALKAASGDLLWRRQLLLETDASVLSELRAPMARPLYLQKGVIGIERVEDALLASFYQGKVMVLTREDGRQLFSIDASLKSTPLLDQGRLYLATATGELEAIDLATGATVWKQKLSDGELLGPVLANGALWVADDRGNVMRLGLDGDKQAAIRLNGRIERAPAVTSTGVLVRTGLGVLTLLR